jgi:hypothetical protein
MKLSDIVQDWPKTIALIVLTALLFWGYSCQPTVRSLIDPDKRIGRAEIQIELDSIIATAEYRLAELDKQEAFRDVIFKNALLMVESGTVNPMGIITLLAGLYGVARGTKDIKDRVKKTNSS